MKRTATLVVAIMALTLTACKADNNPKKQDNSAMTTEQTGVTNQNEGKETKMTVTEMNSEMFQQKVMDFKSNPKTWNFKGDKPAIIDFYADWCGPCRSLSPKLEEVAKKYAGKLTVYKVNVDKEKELAGIFGVRSIPMVLFVPVKGIPTQTMGNLPMENIEEAIAKIMQSDL